MSHFGATVTWYLGDTTISVRPKKEVNGTQKLFKPNQDAQVSKVATQPTTFS